MHKKVDVVKMMVFNAQIMKNLM
jgi:signal transduction histidine kinase